MRWLVVVAVFWGYLRIARADDRETSSGSSTGETEFNPTTRQGIIRGLPTMELFRVSSVDIQQHCRGVLAPNVTDVIVHDRITQDESGNLAILHSDIYQNGQRCGMPDQTGRMLLFPSKTLDDGVVGEGNQTLASQVKRHIEQNEWVRSVYEALMGYEKSNSYVGYEPEERKCGTGTSWPSGTIFIFIHSVIRFTNPAWGNISTLDGKQEQGVAVFKPEGGMCLYKNVANSEDPVVSLPSFTQAGNPDAGNQSSTPNIVVDPVPTQPGTSRPATIQSSTTEMHITESLTTESTTTGTLTKDSSTDPSLTMTMPTTTTPTATTQSTGEVTRTTQSQAFPIGTSSSVATTSASTQGTRSTTSFGMTTTGITTHHLTSETTSGRTTSMTHSSPMTSGSGIAEQKPVESPEGDEDNFKQTEPLKEEHNQSMASPHAEEPNASEPQIPNVQLDTPPGSTRPPLDAFPGDIIRISAPLADGTLITIPITVGSLVSSSQSTQTSSSDAAQQSSYYVGSSGENHPWPSQFADDYSLVVPIDLSQGAPRHEAESLSNDE